MRALFTAALFLGSALLFLIQPMFAKMLLPHVGGASAVWTTCLVFFQTALLVGYAYAHALPPRLGARRQAMLHLGVLAAPFCVLPIAVRHGAWANAGGDPTAWLLGSLAASVGAPFLVLAAGGPLLQRWFAETAPSEDPYPLFAASNVGSLVGLVGYPLVIEPLFGLAAQARLFAWGYVVYAALAAGGAIARARRSDPVRGAAPDEHAAAPAALERLRWIALAFVPSSLLLGATTYLGADVAAVPLLWVPPLALYLISFIVVFARARPEAGALREPDERARAPFASRPPRGEGAAHAWLRVCYVALAIGLYFFALPRITQHFAVAALHLALVLLGGLLFHGELARRRPAPRALTSFYLSIAAGGALGGVFGSLVAPLLFRGVHEYPLAIALSLVLLPRPAPVSTPSEAEREAAFLRSIAASQGAASQGAASQGAASESAALGVTDPGPAREHSPAKPSRGRALDVIVPALAFALTLALGHRYLGAPIAFGVPLLACVFVSLRRQARLGLGMIGIALAAAALPGTPWRERSYFGVMRVDDRGATRTLFHGTTIHGVQRLDAPREPQLYYARGAPIGQLFDALAPRLAGARVAAIGLGVGALAAYAEPGQRWTFYEIDAAVERIARRWFTFLGDARAPIDVVLGDARLTIARANAGEFRLIVLDAFSSDAIPTHLLTREAFGVYREKLAPGGVITVHISNRHLHLDGVLAEIARDAGLAARIERGRRDDASNPARATWVALARSEADLGPLARDPRWETLRDTKGPLWTDDHSDLLGVLGAIELPGAQECRTR